MSPISTTRSSPLAVSSAPQFRTRSGETSSWRVPRLAADLSNGINQQTPRASGALLEVWVVPGASQSEIVGLYGSSVKVRVTSAAEDGKANREVTRLLEKELGRQVTLLRGITSRRKVFQVAGVDADFIVKKLRLDL